MRILLTGASGFIGRQILQALVDQGHHVFAISRTRQSVTGTTLMGNFFEAEDRRRMLAEAQPQIIIHAAWFIEHGTFWHAPENRLWFEHSRQFIQEAKHASVDRFVGLGTCYEYAWPNDAPCDESTTPLAIHTPYDAAKAHTRDYLASQDDKAFSTAWARLFLMYGAGEGEKRLGPSVAQALLRGDIARCSAGVAIRDFLDVRDVGAALAALALSHVRGAVNIASGEALSIADFARAIGEELGCPERIALGALPDRPEEPPCIVASVHRLRDEVGFTPAISMREGIRTFCEDQRFRLFVDR